MTTFYAIVEGDPLRNGNWSYRQSVKNMPTAPALHACNVAADHNAVQ